MSLARIFRLDAATPEGVRRFLSDRISPRQFSEGRRTTVVTITRTGKFYDPRYGDFEITKDMLLSMVKNFEADVYGQHIVLDLSHRPAEGSAGFFKRLFLEDNGNKLRGEVELTEYGVDAVIKRGFIYVSAEFSENYIDNEQRQPHGPTLLGAALTPRPVIKRQDPVQLSEGGPEGVPVYINPKIVRLLSEEIAKMKELLEALRKKLAELKLGEGIVKQLCEAYETAAKPLGEEALQRALMEQFVTTGQDLAKQLAEAKPDATIQLSMGSGLSAEDVKKLMAEAQAEQDKQTKKLTEAKAANVKTFTDLVTGAEGLKSLSEDTRNKLLSAQDLITPEMTEDQVKRLAEHQIQLGSDMAVAAKLAAQGYNVPGTVRISVDESNVIKELQEKVDKRLGFDGMSESRRYARLGGKLLTENKQLAEQALALYDQQHAAQLHAEHKMLAGGDGVIADTSVPASFERTVIREALYSLVGLQFVNAGTEVFANSHSIPYSYRDTTAAGRNNTRVYQGNAILRAGVKQAMDTAYPMPQKLAFEVSDEVRYLTSNGMLNWEIVGENQRNASRIIGEDLEQVLFNEQLHASDEYGATAVTDENLELQADDTKNVFILAHFPVVRPRAIYDLAGAQVGSTTNPITVTYDSVARSEYDGTGNQAAGIYYVLDYNLGEIYLVDESGAIQTPANGTAYTISYSYTSNVYAFDTDLGSDAADVHWDDFLYRYALRKSLIEDSRYYNVDMGLMSGTVMDQISRAKQFGANSKRNGTDLMADGNLGRIKDVPNFKATAPGLWMGDQRVVIGARGQTRLRITKPWTLGQLENQRDANGRFTGQKEAYGDQFIVVHTPIPLKAALTSMVLYSATARVARVTP